jgi:hypothetical protein
MEVHHHPDLHHHRKKWKEYALECLMIFLAVTLGFFAETTRESISERHREREYIGSLISNLQSDTASLTGLIDRNALELRGIDSLLKTARNDFAKTAVQDSMFYYAVNYTLSLHLFQFNDLTLVQLRNAGGYSLIRTSGVADSIAQYESKNTEIKIQERFYTDSYQQTGAVFRQVFDATLAEPFFQSYNSANKIPADINVLIAKDQERIHLLYNNYWTYAIILRGYNSMLTEHLGYLTGLMHFLKQKYGLD